MSLFRQVSEGVGGLGFTVVFATAGSARTVRNVLQALSDRLAQLPEQ